MAAAAQSSEMQVSHARLVVNQPFYLLNREHLLSISLVKLEGTVIFLFSYSLQSCIRITLILGIKAVIFNFLPSSYHGFDRPECLDLILQKLDAKQKMTSLNFYTDSCFDKMCDLGMSDEKLH